MPSILRSSVELVGWVAVPWALAGYSPLVAIVVTVLLVVGASLAGTVGDRGTAVAPVVAVPGVVTVGLTALQFAVALVAAWWLSAWLGALVLLLVAAGVVAELPRWRWLRRH
ncbi:MAG TPA: hypothetical protein VGX23_22200 [Actinocrinis sp.]|nr:hypothetical protein [Actinocrinis sp.]